MSDAHADHDLPHEGPIKTPKQLMWAVVAAFLVPIIAIIVLVNSVVADKKPAAGSTGLTEEAIAERLHRWTRALMITARAAELPEVLLRELKQQFLIPQAGMRVWGVAQAFESLPFAQGASDDAKSLATSLSLPYCGANAGFEAARWLDDAASVASMAMVPLARVTNELVLPVSVVSAPSTARSP